MLTTLLAVAAASWGVVMALAPLLQLRRMLHRDSSDDVSIGYLVLLLSEQGISGCPPRTASPGCKHSNADSNDGPCALSQH